MRNIDKIYIDGQFVTPKGTEMADLHNPSTEEKIGTVQLAGVEDAREAIAAAKRVMEGDVYAGFQTPAMLFGPMFATDIAGTRIIDLPNR